MASGKYPEDRQRARVSSSRENRRSDSIRDEGCGTAEPRGADRNFGQSPEQRPEHDFRGRGPRGYRRSDERICEDVCESLTDDPYIDASDIEVTVKSGEVTLVGTVSAREAKRHAEDLVNRVSGVRDVRNTLRIATAVITAESDIEGVGGTPGAASGMSGANGH